VVIERAERAERDDLDGPSPSLPERALAALLSGQEPPVEALADPAALVPVVDAARRVWLERGRPPRLEGLPPCLDMTVRPSEPLVPLGRAFSPPPPCDDCSHAMWCSANAMPPRGDRTGLRPLRNREPAAAVLAALRSIYEAWEVPDDPVVIAWVHELLALRRGGLGGPPPPFELSLKRQGDRLAPLVRVVDLHPQIPPAWPAREAHVRRRDRLREHACGLDPGPSAAAIDEFLELVAAHQPDRDWWLSYGIEAPVQGGPLRVQLYAHVQHDDAAAVRTLVRAVLRWAGATASDIERFTAFSDPRPIVLIAHAPLPRDPRHVKIYVTAPLDSRDPGSGLEPLARPRHAPSSGLAVLRCDASGPAWEKWDHRCAAQFQSSGPVFEDFVAGMLERDARRARAITSGTHFVAWPTWLSVRPDARTIYFNPR